MSLSAPFFTHALRSVVSITLLAIALLWALPSSAHAADARPALVLPAIDAHPSPQLALRLNHLSAEERAALDDPALPAGGELGTMGALLSALALLIVTDALGYTDVFPFIEKTDNATD